MSLSEVNLLSVVRKQYLYKLKAFSTSIYSLMIVQLLGLLISLGGVGSTSFHTDNIGVSIKYYSASLIIVSSFLWVFVKAFWLPAKNYKSIDFTLVTNRLSSNLSNIGVLLTACIYTGFTATLAGPILRVILYLSTDHSSIVAEGFAIVVSELILGIIVSFLYMVLLGSIGYFLGTLTQINSFFAILLPVAFLGLVWTGRVKIIENMFQFFASETSLIMLAFKMILTSVVLLGVSIILTNRMEVAR